MSLWTIYYIAVVRHSFISNVERRYVFVRAVDFVHVIQVLERSALLTVETDSDSSVAQYGKNTFVYTSTSIYLSFSATVEFRKMSTA